MVDMGEAISAVQKYADDSVAEAVAPLNDQIAALQQQLADCQAGSGEGVDPNDQTLVDSVADWVATKKSLADNEATRQALLTWQSAKGLSPTPAPAVTMSVGCRNSTVDWATFEQKMGPVAVTRFFHGDLPAKQTRTYSGITVPDNVVLWVSFRDGTTDANLRSYLADMDPRTVLIFHHEPEGDYASGSDFVSKFDHYADIVHSASPGTLLVHAASGYNYGGTRPGTTGAYIPDSADAYTIDSYQGRTSTADMEPLEQDDQFQKWLSLVGPKGKPIGLTEYGRGIEPSTAEMDSKRIELMQTDHAYLKSLPNVITWQYWWAAKTSSDDWTFDDPAGQQQWRDIAQEHNNA